MTFDANSPHPSDARPLSLAELLSALHGKFSANLATSRVELVHAQGPEAKARALSACSAELRVLAGNIVHQRLLATYIDELFGDSVCAVYLASCGLTVPARMLLRRSFELGLVVIAYWDSPAEFWTWRDHDGDIRFTSLYGALSGPGYCTYLKSIPRLDALDTATLFAGLPDIYRELSDVVHPKPRNFATRASDGYSFTQAEFLETIGLADRVYESITKILVARFPDLQASANLK